MRGGITRPWVPDILWKLFLIILSLWIRAVTKLLEDLVFFVVDIPNSGQDVLEIMVNKPNRERQKLMREQNILKQVSPPHDLNGRHFQTS